MMKVGMKNKAMAERAQREKMVQRQNEIRRPWRSVCGVWSCGVDGAGTLIEMTGRILEEF
jgi:hypothetical protein